MKNRILKNVLSILIPVMLIFSLFTASPAADEVKKDNALWISKYFGVGDPAAMLDKNIGDIIPFVIESRVPYDIDDAEVTEFNIKDDLGNKFAYQGGSVKVYLRDTLLDATTDYIFTYTGNNSTGGLITVDFLHPLTSVFDVFKGKGGEKITIKFDTVLLVNQSADNDAVLFYNDDPPLMCLNLPAVLFCEIEIQKTDAANGSLLDGAAFKILNAEGYAKKQKEYLRKDSRGNIVYPGDSEYESAADFEVTTVDGLANIRGLRYERDSNQNATVYYLHETRVPHGYNPLANPFTPITVPHDVNEGINTGVYQVTITNRSGFRLPITGGAGVILFSILGTVLIGGAVVLFTIAIKKKKGA